MRNRLIAIATAVVVPAAALTAAQAAPGARSHHPHFTRVVVRTASGHKCTNTAINGINDKGTALGTLYCGNHETAFIRTRGGKVTRYTLPRADAHFTLGANIASNGLVALVGKLTRRGTETSYLLATNGDLTTIADPSAAGFGTVVNGVNRHGTAVGEYCIDAKCSSFRSFIYRRGSFHDFVMHGSKRVLPSLSQITDSGTLIGSFFQAPTGYSRGFVRSGGRTRVIDAPGAVHKLAKGTFVLNAGSHGMLCGAVVTRHHQTKGYVRFHGHSHVFALHPSARTPVTEVVGCNGHGVVGGLTNVRKTSIGFLGRI